jgi:CHASE2 domain-containing sensor protein
MLGLLLAAALASGIGLAARAGGWMQWLERGTVDARFSLRGSLGPSHEVSLVAIDNNSLALLPRPPFPRQFDAKVIERLHAAGARLVVYDEAFERPAPPPQEQALRAAVRRAAPTVLAANLVEEGGETEVLGGNATLRALGGEAGAAYLPVDPDGVVRHTLYQFKGLPTIAADVAARVLRHPPASKRYEGGWIDFRGGPGTFQSIPFYKVWNGEFDKALVRGRVVVVGATAPVLQDQHSTAGGSPMSGPELQANAIATALADFPLRSSPAAVSILLVLALALLAPLLAARFGTLGGLGALLVGGVLWSLATQLSFDSNTVLDYSDPLLALVVGTVGAMTLGLVGERAERRELRLRFAADAGSLVEQVLRDPLQRRLPATAIIGGYRLEEVLARGGMGVIYRARQLALGRPVAIKLIAPERAQDSAFRERFELESRMAAAIEHANIIPVYEAGEDHGLLFIAMRLVEGVDLGALLERGGPLEPARTARLVAQVAGALDAAHAGGLVHRDVKPANILVTVEEPEHAYLTDFGVAKHTGEPARITRAGQWVGTLDYLAPEQIRCEQVTGSADVYALTGVLYHCLTGHPPYEQSNDAARLWAHLSEPPPTPSRRTAGLPRALDAVIARGMAKSASARYGSAGELARACARALGVSELDLPPAPPPHPAGARAGTREGEQQGASAATLIAE